MTSTKNNYYFSYSLLFLLFVLGDSLNFIVRTNLQILILLFLSLFQIFKLRITKIKVNSLKIYMFTSVAIIFLNLRNSINVDSLISLKFFFLVIPAFIFYFKAPNIDELLFRYFKVITIAILFLICVHFLGFINTKEIVFGEGFVKEVSYVLLASNECVMLGLFFLIKYSESKNIFQLFFSVVFFAIPHLFNFEIQRGILMASIFSILVGLGFFKGPFKLRSFSLKPIRLFFFGSAFILLIYNLNESNKQKIDSIYNIITLQEIDNLNDSSIKGRINEINLVFEELVPNPIFGNGYFRPSLANDMFAERFFIADIGLIGVFYTLGLFGILLYIFQFFSFLSFFSYKHKNIRNHNFMLFRCFLGYLIIISISTGVTIHKFALFLAVLIILKMIEKNEIDKFNYTNI